MTRGRAFNWTPALDERIRTACANPGRLRDLAAELGLAYSTLTSHARALKVRPVRERRQQFNTRPKAGPLKLDPDLPIVISPNVKITRVAFPEDTRFKADPADIPAGGYLDQWHALRGHR